MTKSLITLLLLFSPFFAWFQGAPTLISYQAVLRDAQGTVVANEDVSVEFAIRASDMGGEIVFEESHPLITTTNFGVFSVLIGSGIPTGVGIYTGLDEIPWHLQTYFVEVRAILPSQSDPVVLGVAQMLSVPYALHSQTADTVLNETDGSITNETLSNITFDGTNLIFQEGSSSYTYDVAALLTLVGGDNDSNNELVESLTALDETTLQIIEAGNTVSADVSAISYATWGETNDVVYNLNQRIGVGTNTPTSTLHNMGSQSVAFRTVAGNSGVPGPTVDQLNDNDQVLLCNITEEDVTITLPDVTICSGRVYKIRKFSTSPSSYDVNLVPISGQFIEGTNSYTMGWPLGEYVTLLSTGATWILIDHSKE